jgi:hypothetical protein
MKLKPWRGKLRQNTHQFTSVISLTEPRRIDEALGLAATLRQLGDIPRDPPRLILGEQLGRRAPASVFVRCWRLTNPVVCGRGYRWHPGYRRQIMLGL